jgi:hypothetical protein
MLNRGDQSLFRVDLNSRNRFYFRSSETNQALLATTPDAPGQAFPSMYAAGDFGSLFSFLDGSL